MKAMLAPSWVWNIMKNLERKKIQGARRWLFDETKKLMNGLIWVK